MSVSEWNKACHRISKSIINMYKLFLLLLPIIYVFTGCDNKTSDNKQTYQQKVEKSAANNDKKISKPENDVKIWMPYSQTLDKAIKSGLLWLARHQNPDGSWGARSFQNQCKNTRCSGVGDKQFDIGL